MIARRPLSGQPCAVTINAFDRAPLILAVGREANQSQRARSIELSVESVRGYDSDGGQGMAYDVHDGATE